MSDHDGMSTNTEHLNRVVARLSKVKDVLKVTRS